MVKGKSPQNQLQPEESRQLWVSYRLQSLPTNRFVRVTNKILGGEYALLRPLSPQK